MSESLLIQVKDYIENHEIQCLKYIVSDESQEVIERLCTDLNENEVKILKDAYNEVIKENKRFQIPEN